MSARIRYVTPMIHKQYILEALHSIGERYTDRGDTIVIDSRQLYGMTGQLTKGANGKFILTGDSEAVGREFTSRLVPAYRDAVNKSKERMLVVEAERRNLLKRELIESASSRSQADASTTDLSEQESLRMEQELLRQEQERTLIDSERRHFVDGQKKLIYQKAETMGYDVTETIHEGKTKLVLVKRSY